MFMLHKLQYPESTGENNPDQGFLRLVKAPPETHMVLNIM